MCAYAQSRLQTRLDNKMERLAFQILHKDPLLPIFNSGHWVNPAVVKVLILFAKDSQQEVNQNKAQIIFDH